MPFIDWLEALPASEGERAWRLLSFESGGTVDDHGGTHCVVRIGSDFADRGLAGDVQSGVSREGFRAGSWNMSLMLMG